MSRKKGSKNKIKPKVAENIKITVKSLGRVFEAEGKTFEEAVGKIKISNGAMALSVITVEKGKETIKTKILNARHTNGLFGQGSPSFRAIHLKGVKQILGVE